MKHLRLYEILGLIVLLALTAFAGVSCANAAGDNLAGKTWVLQQYGDPDNLTQAITGKEPTLTFDKDKMTVGGNGGVNGYGGDYTVDKDKLTVSDVISTLIASSNEEENIQESTFFKILHSAETFKIEGTNLTITGTEGVLIFGQK